MYIVYLFCRSEFKETWQPNGIHLQRCVFSTPTPLLYNLPLECINLEINLIIFVCWLSADLLDRVFVCFRKSSMDETLDAITRMSLLEAIELRAGNWQLHEPTVNYYTKKLNFLVIFFFFLYHIIQSCNEIPLI